MTPSTSLKKKNKMYADFKLVYIRRNTQGYISEAVVKFFEGQISNETEVFTESEGGNRNVSRYRRSGLLSAQTYTDKDFGQIKTDDDLNSWLKTKLLLKYPLHTLIPELDL